MQDINISIGGMHWPKRGATQYYAQLGLPDKGRVIKELVVCYPILYIKGEKKAPFGYHIFQYCFQTD